MFGFRKKVKEPVRDTSFDGEAYTAAMRCSICTGERVAGFKNSETGKFEEVTVITSDRDLEEFRKKYGVDRIETFY